MKKLLFLALFIIFFVLLLCACTTGGAAAQYEQITPERARELMDSESGYVILDVRTEEEYAAGHIPGAILIPDNEIEEGAKEKLRDKKQLILVYCRSARRSKLASEKLAELGYGNVKEFGGIIDWKYEVVTD